MSTLDRAVNIASSAHQGQTDKAGRPYILHPLRLMMRFEQIEAQIVAVLHDVVEDSSWTFEQLEQEGFSEQIVAALRCLTKQKGENYEDFIERILPNPLASQVKLKDIEDNMDLKRLEKIGEKDLARVEKYHRAWKELSK